MYDGIRKIDRIHILGLYRCNEHYLSFLFKRFNEWESFYTDIKFQYYFLENDSTDKTRELLNEFVKSRKNSKLILYKLKKDYKNVDDGRGFNRISTLAKLRNTLINNITPLPPNEWCLIIDSNIYFQDDIMSQIFCECQPSDQNIGMMCVYAQQLMLPEIHTKIIKEPILMKHFYDTYSIIDIKGQSFFPQCPFEKCTICTKHQANDEKKKHIQRIPAKQGVVEVSSCFGGFVMIKSDVLNNPNVRWGSICFDLSKDISLCEHLLFCDRLRSITNKKIVVLQNIDTIYRTI